MKKISESDYNELIEDSFPEAYKAFPDCHCEALRTALEEYGMHKEGCDYPVYCNCGYIEALAPTEKTKCETCKHYKICSENSDMDKSIMDCFKGDKYAPTEDKYGHCCEKMKEWNLGGYQHHAGLFSWIKCPWCGEPIKEASR